MALGQYDALKAPQLCHEHVTVTELLGHMGHTLTEGGCEGCERGVRGV